MRCAGDRSRESTANLGGHLVVTGSYSLRHRKSRNETGPREAMKNNIAITAIITAGIVVLVIHFTPRPQPKTSAAPTARGMSQAELFNMNGKCGELAG
jgi:hypothetical protein